MDNKIDLSKLDLSSLNKLSDAEKEQVLKILTDIGNQGFSDDYNKMLYEDYAEIPVDILTFVDDYNYLGNAWHDAQGNSKLYPYWRKELVKIFPNNLDTNVNNAIFTGSRGRGKSEIASLCMAYILHRLLCLKNPVEHFHLKPTEKVVLAFMNIKLDLAEEIGIAKFQNTIKSSPWFLAHGTLEGRTNKVWIPQKYRDANGNEKEAIDIKIGSQSDDLIGLPVFAVFFDEISFIKNRDIEAQKTKAKDMIDTALGGMDTRFIYKGKNPTLLMLASSKRSDKSFLEDYIKKKLASEGTNVYISDGPVWECKPEGTYGDEWFTIALGNKFLESVIVPEGADWKDYEAKGYKPLKVPMMLKHKFEEDMERNLCDFAGISSSSISKYINGEAWKSLIRNDYQNAFSSDILEIGDGPDDDVQYYNFFDVNKIPESVRNKPLFIHLDMSYTGDKTGIAGTFIDGKKPSVDPALENNDLFYRVGFSTSIKAPKGRHISFAKNRNFIYWLKAQGFNIRGITSDTYQSYDTGQELLSKGYNYEVLSVDRCNQSKICEPYQYFKTAIYEKRVAVYPNRLLTQEVTDLERDINTGKVDHPADGSKDQSDAVCGSIFNASKYAAEFAYTYGETAETILRINMGENTYGDNLLQNSSEELRNQLMSREDNIFRIQKEHMNNDILHPQDEDDLIII